jgi:hypothetical protein
MGKRGRILIALTAVALLGVLAWVMLGAPSSPPEPVYKGKPLSYWLRGYGFPSTNGPSRYDADGAISAVGTNAIPTLLRMLCERDVSLKSKFLNWAVRYSFFRAHYHGSVEINFEAMSGFGALGPQAAGAISDLIQIMDKNSPPETRSFSANILGGMGPEAAAAVPSLLRAATNADTLVRNSAIWALGEIRADPDAVVPVLVKALHDPFPPVRQWAASGLGNFGPVAKSAVPVMVAILNEPIGGSNSVPVTRGAIGSVRTIVAGALLRIDPEFSRRMATHTAASSSQ